MRSVATLHVTSLSKSYGADTLFSDVSFRVTPGQRLALVGRNGSGKTTLLRILAGEIGLDGGEVGFPRNARIALHDQRPPRTSGKSLMAYVGESLADLHETEERLAALEQRMAGRRPRRRDHARVLRGARPSWSTPAATRGARGWSRSCAASASTRPTTTATCAPSPAAS